MRNVHHFIYLLSLTFTITQYYWKRKKCIILVPSREHMNPTTWPACEQAVHWGVARDFRARAVDRVRQAKKKASPPQSSRGLLRSPYSIHHSHAKISRETPRESLLAGYNLICSQLCGFIAQLVEQNPVGATWIFQVSIKDNCLNCSDSARIIALFRLCKHLTFQGSSHHKPTIV